MTTTQHNDVSTDEPALCVDLDGTLTYTDLSFETLLYLLRRNFLYAFLVPFWLLRGRPHLKRQILSRVTLDAAHLPYNEELLIYLNQERDAGRWLVLITASGQQVADAVSKNFPGLFHESIGTTYGPNMSGSNKRAFLDQKFGNRNYDYAGNSTVDLKVWEGARKAIVVNSNPSLVRKASERADLGPVFLTSTTPLVDFIRAIRVHQWVKNFLLFVPLITAHQIMNLNLALSALLAFLSFSLCASGVYVLNDMVDVEADRLHPKKRRRPFAAGRFVPQHGLLFVPTLWVGSACIASFLPFQFGVTLFLYFLLTTLYSFVVKRLVLFDIIFLASLYTIRILAGGTATGVPVSEWLLAFSLFFFLSLALVKRFSELAELRKSKVDKAHGRGYLPVDLELISSMGAASGYISILVLALYIHNEKSAELYRYPELIWLLCPLILYWISRVWLLAHRGEMHEDPIVFAIKDKVSYFTGIIALAIMGFAI